MKLHADKPGLGSDKVKIATVDRYKGHEADIYVLMLFWISSLLTIQNSPLSGGRMKTAVTRAKKGSLRHCFRGATEIQIHESNLRPPGLKRDSTSC